MDTYLLSLRKAANFSKHSFERYIKYTFHPNAVVHYGRSQAGTTFHSLNSIQQRSEGKLKEENNV